MMRWAAVFLALPAFAHTISMSTGDLRIDGSRAVYQLRMPAYELVHMQEPERTLFEHIHFSANGHDAALVTKSCHDSPADAMFVCDAAYDFGAPVETFQAECQLARVTVPNHVHILRAYLAGKGGQADKTDQAVFDATFEKADVRFRPPTQFEIAVKDIAAGVIRATGTLAGLLFLIALAFASRSLRELAQLAAAFAAGEIAACAVLPHIRFDPSSRFVEAAMALTVAYLAVEILFLPNAGARSIVCGVLGLFHGLYFALFLRNADFHIAYFLAGALALELSLLAILWAALRKIPWASRYAAMILLVLGLAWFGMRLIG